jgi:26S proteasome regulatory subunit T3
LTLPFFVLAVLIARCNSRVSVFHLVLTIVIVFATFQVEFPIPDRRQKRLIFGVCTSKMSLADDVDLESFVARPDKLSGAEIASICLEAGMQAVRKNRYIIMQKDFDKAFKVVLKKDNDDYQFYK